MLLTEPAIRSFATCDEEDFVCRSGDGSGTADDTGGSGWGGTQCPDWMTGLSWSSS